MTDSVSREYSTKVRSALGNRVKDIILFGSRTSVTITLPEKKGAAK